MTKRPDEDDLEEEKSTLAHGARGSVWGGLTPRACAWAEVGRVVEGRGEGSQEAGGA